jgi:tetratricopeptide (TPR) repeat protein
MATDKNEPTVSRAADSSVTGIAAYEAAKKEYQNAIELIYRRDFAAAKELFTKIEAEHGEETEMVERCRTYGKVCDNKLAGEPSRPESVDDCYYQAVLLTNEGRAEEAVALLDRALVQDPSSVRVLYARACAWALQNDPERAVSDLRGAIAIDPTVRFQATNDQDFERIREEPAFIDVIEPTPAGA